MTSDLAIGFVLGLAGSLHCLQMCGPLVAVAGRSPLFYHSGRILTYALLGGAAGLIGTSADRLGGLARVESLAAVLAGAGMMIAGVLLFGLIRKPGLVSVGPASVFTRTVAKCLKNPSKSGQFATGLLMGFLPCGLVYAALLKSIATGDATPGALTMLGFGLGTTGPLLGLNLVSARLMKGWGGQWATRFSAVAVMLIGAILVWRGIMPVTAGHRMHHH